MSDIVLVYPKSFYLEKAMNHFYLPLSLLNTVIYAEKEYSVKIIDQRTDRNWKKKLLKELNQNPLCVGTTSQTGEQIKYALEISKFVKEESKTPVVWGGAHPGILSKQTLEHPLIDYVIEGEGEISFYNLVKSLDKNKPLNKVKGLWYKKNNKIKKNPPQKLVNLNSLPNIPYHLVDINKYILRFNKQRMFILETSRGCPHKCAFCFVQNTASQKKWRALTPENTVEKIKFISDKFNVKIIEFRDLNSMADLKRMENICNLLLKEKVDTSYITESRIDDILRMKSEYLRLLEKSNIIKLVIGVESGSNRILKMINKGITVKQVLDASKKISKTKISPYYAFIAGFPSETEKEVKMTTNLIIKLLEENPLAKTSLFHCYRPTPGNSLFDLSVKYGLKPPNSLEEWSKYSIDWIDHPWLSESMKKKIKTMNFLSLFLDKKYEEIDSLLVQTFTKIYKPLARYRFKNYNFNFMIEPYFKKIYTSFII